MALDLDIFWGVYEKNLDKDDFLKLIVDQIYNKAQLELNSNGDFLVPFSVSNECLNKEEESLKQLAYSLQSNQALQASSFVGRKVMVISNIIKLDSEGASKVYVDVPVALDELKAVIYSQTGELIREIFLKRDESGFFKYHWDGFNQNGEYMVCGKYIIQVSACDNGQEIVLQTKIAANIDSVRLGKNGEGVKLIVDGIGEMALDEVRNITPW